MNGVQPSTSENQQQLVIQTKNFLKDLFKSKLTRIPFLVFESLGPQRHFYPPKVKKVEASPCQPLVFDQILGKLKQDFENFEKLLISRREQFIRRHDWEDEDSELCSSSSDSDHDYVVEEVLNDKVKKGQRYFLIQFKYYSEPEWIREIHLAGCRDLVQNYLNSKKT